MATVIVIDDDDKVRTMMRQALERAGHEVVEAGDGRAGLELYRRHPPDVVVTNIYMPERDGLEVIREIRRQRHRVPVIAVSGGVSMRAGSGAIGGVLDAARQLGAASVLAKPFDIGQLLSAVAAALASPA